MNSENLAKGGHGGFNIPYFGDAFSHPQGVWRV